MGNNDKITNRETVRIGNCSCTIYSTPSPQFILIQPTARHEARHLDEEALLLAHDSDRGFVFIAFDVEKWAAALMPWHDDAVSKDAEVGSHATATLRFVTHEALPYMMHRYGLLPCIVGGYSLGGLFALWASCLTDSFTAVAAASPSLWIEGWADFAAAHHVSATKVYLSLGDTEEHCKNARMARIGDCLRWQHQLLSEQIGSNNVTLEWNEGNHFHNEAQRMAKAFAWCMRAVSD